MKINRFSYILFCFFTLTFSGCEQSDLKSATSEIGHHFFFDKRLSFNHTKSCASCHAPSLAFSDGYRTSISAEGKSVLHNAPSLLNIAAMHFFDWANDSIQDLETQMHRPLYNHNPIELGLDIHWNELKTLIIQDKTYQKLFKEANISIDSIGPEIVIHTITAYLKQLNSLQSPYDSFLKGNQHALREEQQQGMKLFFSSRLKCSTCHGGIYFSNATINNKKDSVYFNIGLYNIKNQHSYPYEDFGLGMNTHLEKDNGRYKVPSLRNVMITSPYMHDGSLANIQDVIKHYAQGGSVDSLNPHIGNGKNNTYKHANIQGFSISDLEKKALISFLESLTDTSYLHQNYFLNPWEN